MCESEENHEINFCCVKCSKVQAETMLGITIVNHCKCIARLPNKIQVCKLCIELLQIDLMTGNFSILNGVKKLFGKVKK
jgi:hypothetical protein